jgi:hypothetical protein
MISAITKMMSNSGIPIEPSMIAAPLVPVVSLLANRNIATARPCWEQGRVCRHGVEIALNAAHISLIAL